MHPESGGTLMLGRRRVGRGTMAEVSGPRQAPAEAGPARRPVHEGRGAATATSRLVPGPPPGPPAPTPLTGGSDTWSCTHHMHTRNIHTNTHVRAHSHAHTCMHTHTRVCILTHVHAHSHTHVCAHSHTPTSTLSAASLSKSWGLTRGGASANEEPRTPSGRPAVTVRAALS